MLRASTLLLALALALSAPAALADVEDVGSAYVPPRAVRRSDFAAGVGLGAVLGNVTGYPNELSKLNDPRYEASTGFGAGPGGSLWLGAALRDWLTVGVGAQTSNLSGQGVSSTGTAFIVHLEGYPAFSLGGPFRDLGVYGDFGAGGRSVKRDSNAVAEGGVLSVVTFGAVYETLRLGGHLSAGPALELRHEWSRSLNATALLAGFRIAFYGGP